MTRHDLPLHWLLLLLALAALGVALVLRVDATDQVIEPLTGRALPPSCLFRRLTGIGCPGCGLTRCFICLVHGDVSRAWTFNPSGMLIFLVVAAQVPYRVLQIWRIRSQQPQFRLVTLTTIGVSLLCVCLIGQWLCRLL